LFLNHQWGINFSTLEKPSIELKKQQREGFKQRHELALTSHNLLGHDPRSSSSAQNLLLLEAKTVQFSVKKKKRRNNLLEESQDTHCLRFHRGIFTC